MTETHTPLRLNAGDETRIMEDRPDGVCLPVCEIGKSARADTILDSAAAGKAFAAIAEVEGRRV